MANGNYSQSGGYRGDRSSSDRDFSRDASSDYRPGDTGYVRDNGDQQRSSDRFGSGDRFGASRDESDRSRSSSRYGRGEQWANDDFGYEPGYGDTERSQAWARESYRGRPSSFSYEPGRNRVNQAYGDRYGSDYRSGSEERYGGDRYRGSEDYGRKRGFMERAGDEVASWFGDEDAEQRRMMDAHRGKGPKGYQRSDSRIEEDVNDRLSDDPILDASNITVTVKEAEVTLDGFVASRWDKRRAEDITDDISGVKHVQNNLRVNIAPTDTLTGSTTI